MAGACIHSQPETSQVVRTTSKPAAQNSPHNPQQNLTSKPVSDASCLSFRELKQTLPMWLRDKGFVITRMLKECTTSDGQRGYPVPSDWVAMGFPCTNGKGRVDVGGHYWAPKIVSMILSTDCGMEPGTMDQVRLAGNEALKLNPSSRLLALNPFTVQYWEIPGLQDADVGFSVQLRSVEAIQRVWRSFLEKKPIPVKLYGRENAWARGYDFFSVDGELETTGTHSFRLKINEVKPLSKEEIEAIRGRCESLQPRRDCSAVFS